MTVREVSGEEMIEALEHEELLQAAKYEKLEDLAKALATTGLLEETCEQLQAQLVETWLASEDQHKRERCWHEIRAVEEIRHELASRLAAPQSETHERLILSAWGWKRWRRIFKRMS